MSYKVILDPLAREDINESIDWYNKRKAKLGKQFYKKVNEVLLFVKKNPYSFVVRYNYTRMAPIEKFPFMVHYTINEIKKEIPVLGVLHTSRNPVIWKEGMH